MMIRVANACHKGQLTQAGRCSWPYYCQQGTKSSQLVVKPVSLGPGGSLTSPRSHPEADFQAAFPAPTFPKKVLTQGKLQNQSQHQTGSGSSIWPSLRASWQVTPISTGVICQDEPGISQPESSLAASSPSPRCSRRLMELGSSTTSRSRLLNLPASQNTPVQVRLKMSSSQLREAAKVFSLNPNTSKA